MATIAACRAFVWLALAAGWQSAMRSLHTSPRSIETRRLPRRRPTFCFARKTIFRAWSLETKSSRENLRRSLQFSTETVPCQPAETMDHPGNNNQLAPGAREAREAGEVTSCSASGRFNFNVGSSHHVTSRVVAILSMRIADCVRHLHTKSWTAQPRGRHWPQRGASCGSSP